MKDPEFALSLPPSPISRSHSHLHLSPPPSFLRCIPSGAHLCLSPLLLPGVLSLPFCFLSFTGSSFASLTWFLSPRSPLVHVYLRDFLNKLLTLEFLALMSVLAKLKDQVLTSNTAHLTLPPWNGEILRTTHKVERKFMSELTSGTPVGAWKTTLRTLIQCEYVPEKENATHPGSIFNQGCLEVSVVMMKYIYTPYMYITHLSVFSSETYFVSLAL
ncbi:hypothetical protein HJG60_011404 [Phyllostomus discolor]|uniref:Uncharacterized protein n=1 Tax=Phyllostomus discolor TaxID=89673 RepID=A0A834A4P5_9CHIR|nr:hypothetical protein HJG60_011404 [Phyllostomus discolor]